MRRGVTWLADVGQKPRPVLVLTRDEVLDVRANVTVAEVTTQPRAGFARAISRSTAIDESHGVSCV